jgi:hypothetical protein
MTPAWRIATNARAMASKELRFDAGPSYDNVKYVSMGGFMVLRLVPLSSLSDEKGSDKRWLRRGSGRLIHG